MANQTFKDVNANDIKKVFGNSSILWLAVNAYHNDLENICVYEFSKKDFEHDKDLCAIVYGRVNSKGAFKSCKLTTNLLNKLYGEKVKHIVSLSALQEFASENNYNNLGVALEYFLVFLFDGKHGTQKQDKQRKQDIFIDGHFIQLKTSLQTEKTKRRYSTTNDKI